jgi:hypothetical protein
MHIMNDEMNTFPFQAFRKTALLHARPLTEDDYKERHGIIQTREGSASFKPGDYLSRGIQDEEWPITREHFAASYEQVTAQDTEGFASYRAKDMYQAYQILEPFTHRRSKGDILIGKAGDYLVRSGDRMWIIDRTIFEQSYERVL